MKMTVLDVPEMKMKKRWRQSEKIDKGGDRAKKVGKWFLELPRTSSGS